MGSIYSRAMKPVKNGDESIPAAELGWHTIWLNLRGAPAAGKEAAAPGYPIAPLAPRYQEIYIRIRDNA